MTGQDTTNPPEPAGPIAQQPTQIQSNGYQTPISSQQPTGSQPSKKVDMVKVRDWLNVLGVFLIPLMIGVYTIAYNVQQSKISQQQYDNSERAAKESHRADLALQTDQQRETALASYIQNIKDLISTEGLQKSKLGDEVRVIARAQTLITLRQLDGTRKGIVMQFLSEARLITTVSAIESEGRLILIKQVVIINLSGADLSGADLSGVNLVGANLINANLINANLINANLDGTDLRGAHLRGAHLRNVFMRDADLSYADLSDADLSNANLSGADLSYAELSDANLSNANLSGAKITKEQLGKAHSLKLTIMPDNTIHS